MPSAARAKLEIETSQQQTSMSTLTDSGDHKTFTSAADLFSAVSGYAPVVRPNGVITGGAVTPGISGSNDVVDTAALTCYLAGIKTTVAATTDKTITRGLTTDTHIINSITINSSGVVTVIAGVDHTSHSETRGANGGPPFIPVGSIEIAQVRLTSVTAAPVTVDEIFAVPGTHLERYDFPLWVEHNGPSTDDLGEHAGGTIEFASALPLSHTGSVPKKVYASYSEPVFTEIPDVEAFVAPEQTYSAASKQVYNGTIGSSSISLGGGSFTAYLKSGISDTLLGQAGKNLWFKFTPDRYVSEYLLCQGVFGLTRAFPAGDNITASCTISPFKPAVNVVE